MAYPGIGYKSYLQYGRESVWGTAVAATHRLPVIAMRPRPQQGMVRSNVLNSRIARSDIYQGGETARVEIEFEMNLLGRLLLLDGLFGTATYGANGGVTSGSDPWTHTFTPKEFLNSYTLELVMGNIPSGKCERIVGAKVAEASFRASAGLEPADAILTCRMTFVGKAYESNQTPTAALTAANPAPFIFHQITTDDSGTADASTSVNMLDFELTVRNALADQRFYMGSQNIDEPIRNGYFEATTRVRQEFQSRTALDEYLALTKGSPNIVFTQSAYSLSIAMPNGVMRSFDHEAAQAGVLEQTFEHEATDDGSSAPLTMVVVNQQSSITA